LEETLSSHDAFIGMKYFIPKVYNCIKTGFKSSLASISALRSAFYTTFLTVYITCLKSILSFKIAKIIHVSYSITALKPDVDKFCFAYLSFAYRQYYFFDTLFNAMFTNETAAILFR